MSLHGSCCRAAPPGFCQIVIWRSTAQGWHGAESNGEPLFERALGSVYLILLPRRTDVCPDVNPRVAAFHQVICPCSALVLPDPLGIWCNACSSSRHPDKRRIGIQNDLPVEVDRQPSASSKS